MQSILNLTNTTKLILATFAFLAVFAFSSGRAHAATLSVSGGCTLPIAINSVNAGANQSGCTASGSYATNDTINIPAGTQTLTADLPLIQEPVNIKGAGMALTVIDGDGQYRGFDASGSGDIAISDLKITGYYTAAIRIVTANVTLNNIDVDGTNALAQTGNNNLFGIFVQNAGNDTYTLSSNNIYLHNITGISSSPNASMNVYVVDQRLGGTTNATINNTTVSDISANSFLNGIALSVGLWNGVGNFGTLNTTITNTTISNLTSLALAAPFSSLAYSGGGGTASVNTTVYNVTITGTRGITYTGAPLPGVKSAAFYSAAVGIGSGTNAQVSVDVGNSLMADNLSSGISNNCTAVDLTSLFSGAGTGTATIASLGHNISDDATCASFTEPGDQQNVNNIIPTLGPLQNNGGVVPTRALLAGSPAIAAGGAVLGVTTDARGIARPSSNPSVGAYQYVLASETTSPASGGTTAPNTGIHSVSLLSVAIATFLGLSAIGYSVSAKRN